MSSTLVRAQSSSHLTHRSLVLPVLLPPHWPLLPSPSSDPGPWDPALANNSRPLTSLHLHDSDSDPDLTPHASPLNSTPFQHLHVCVWVAFQSPHVQSGLPQPAPHTVILIIVMTPHFGCSGQTWGGGRHHTLLLPSHTPHLIHQQALPNAIQIKPHLLPPTPVPAAILSYLDLAATSLLASPPPPLRLLEGRSESLTLLLTSLRVKANVL